MSETPKGQILTKIEERDHYYYDAKSFVIYYVRSGGLKFSTGVKLDNSSEKARRSSLIKASRIVPTKEKEHREKKKKFQKTLAQNRLVGDYLEDMLDKKSHFHRSKIKPVSDETLESYRTSVSHLKPFFEAYLPSELVPNFDDVLLGVDGVVMKQDPWLEFVDHMQAKIPGYNMFNVTKHFRSLTKYLHSHGVISVKPKIFNPFSQKEKVARRKKTHRTYTPGEILLMDAVCNEDQRLALWLGYDQAFRQNDCVELSWERLHLGSNPHVIFHGDDNKAGFVGKIPLSDTCAALLRERRNSTNSPWVFPLKTEPDRHMLVQVFEFEKVIRSSGVKYGSHKTLRHTRLTEDFGDPNLDNALVMKIRRVSLAVALEHYIHPTTADFEKFRNTSKAKRVI